jgi:hypothetical protein
MKTFLEIIILLTIIIYSTETKDLKNSKFNAESEVENILMPLVRLPNRFGKRGEHSVRLPNRLGKRREHSVRLPNRFGKREEHLVSLPDRFGKREDKHLFLKSFDNHKEVMNRTLNHSNKKI